MVKLHNRYVILNIFTVNTEESEVGPIYKHVDLCSTLARVAGIFIHDFHYSYG